MTTRGAARGHDNLTMTTYKTAFLTKVLPAFLFAIYSVATGKGNTLGESLFVPETRLKITVP